MIVGDITCPPFRDKEDENKTDRAAYHFFWDLIRNTSDEYTIIMPRRALFNCGSGIPQWFKDDLKKDEDMEIDAYPHSSEVFPTTDVSGGVGIFHGKRNSGLGPVTDEWGRYYADRTTKSVNKKIKEKMTISMRNMVNKSSYQYSDALYEEHPMLNIGRRISSNTFETLRNFNVFYTEKPTDIECYRIWGNDNGPGTRTNKWINKKYVRDFPGTNKYRVMLANQNSKAGYIGKQWSPMLVIEPNDIYTNTFCCIGEFNTREEAENAEKYIKSDFQRILMDTNRGAEYIREDAWDNIPIQDFTSNSDVDWTLSTRDLSEYFYDKYNFTEEEKEFFRGVK